MLWPVLFPLLHQKRLGGRELHIIHFLEDKLCIWRPTPRDIGALGDNHRVATIVIGGVPVGLTKASMGMHTSCGLAWEKDTGQLKSLRHVGLLLTS